MKNAQSAIMQSLSGGGILNATIQIKSSHWNIERAQTENRKEALFKDSVCISPFYSSLCSANLIFVIFVMVMINISYGILWIYFEITYQKYLYLWYNLVQWVMQLIRFGKLVRASLRLQAADVGWLPQSVTEFCQISMRHSDVQVWTKERLVGWLLQSCCFTEFR